MQPHEAFAGRRELAGVAGGSTGGIAGANAKPAPPSFLIELAADRIRAISEKLELNINRLGSAANRLGLPPCNPSPANPELDTAPDGSLGELRNLITQVDYSIGMLALVIERIEQL